MPLRVGLVCPYDLSIPGGVQAQVLGLASYLNRRGDHPLVIGPGLPDAVEGIDLGRSFSVPGNGSRVPISIDPRIRSKIRAVAGGLDVLHVHEPLMPLVSVFATHAGSPVVATFHAAPGSTARFGYRLMGPLRDRLLGHPAAVTAVSSTAASVLPSSLPVEVIPNGLDVAGFRTDTPRHPSRVVFLGRDEPRKGLDVLLDAWPSIRRDSPEAELVVIGARRDAEGIRWLGRVDETEKVRALASAAVYVAPQTGGESFGIVLVEAMAAGTAVVASNHDAFVAVADGAARFVPAGDSLSLANAVVELLGDNAERERLASAGYRIAARHDWSVVGAAYRDLYDRVVA